MFSHIDFGNWSKRWMFVDKKTRLVTKSRIGLHQARAAAPLQRSMGLAFKQIQTWNESCCCLFKTIQVAFPA